MPGDVNSARSNPARALSPTVGSVHLMLRDQVFTRAGWGAPLMSRVAGQHPDLMQQPATFSRMSRLIAIENEQAMQGPIVTRGDRLAWAFTPMRSQVHMVMMLNHLGRSGVRGLLQQRGYGLEGFSGLTSGTF